MTVWLEDMTSNEILHLKSIYSSDLQRLKKVYFKIITILFFVVGAIFSIMMLTYHFMPPEELLKYNPVNEEESFTPKKVLIMCVLVFIILTLFITIAFSASHYNQNNNLRKDIKGKQKLIEMTTIIEKRYLPHNGTYHFILNSQYKRSYEVDASHFEYFQLGDEVNIEITPYAHFELGIF